MLFQNLMVLSHEQVTRSSLLWLERKFFLFSGADFFYPFPSSEVMIIILINLTNYFANLFCRTMSATETIFPLGCRTSASARWRLLHSCPNLTLLGQTVTTPTSSSTGFTPRADNTRATSWLSHKPPYLSGSVISCPTSLLHNVVVIPVGC